MSPPVRATYLRTARARAFERARRLYIRALGGTPLSQWPEFRDDPRAASEPWEPLWPHNAEAAIAANERALSGA